MNSKLRTLTFVLVLLPFVSFFAQRYFAVQAGQLGLFARHLMVNYADWFFVPFNLFVLSAARFTKKNLFIFLGISLALNLGINYYWSTLSVQGVLHSHLFVSGAGLLTIAGVIHLLFSWVQAGLVGLFFFYTQYNKYTIYCLLSLVCYAATLFFSSYIFHKGKPLITDLGLGVILLSIIVFKFYIYNAQKHSGLAKTNK